jgi:iron(III) transport system ATP-binding protein
MFETMTQAPKVCLQVRNLTKRFGEFVALRDISIDIHEGEFVCFLGPSGCGKTTLLRCIAGLEYQDEGEIRQNDQDISWLPPSARDFGIVFQSYALFPNLTVLDNVAYGLVNRRWSKTKIANRVDELLRLVGLSSHAQKYPAQLSGGEQQRIALSRALAISPGLLMLDEPLSALDAKVRAHLRREIRDLQRRLGVTTIMVTHDQEEAQTMADRIFVMSQGQIEQIGSPSEIYDQPASKFVADFIGVMNFLPATVTGPNSIRCAGLSLDCDTTGLSQDGAINAAIRPEELVIVNGSEVGRNCFEVEILEQEFLGSYARLYLGSADLGNSQLRADVPRALARTHNLEPSDRIQVQIPPDRIRLYQAEG